MWRSRGFNLMTIHRECSGETSLLEVHHGTPFGAQSPDISCLLFSVYRIILDVTVIHIYVYIYIYVCDCYVLLCLLLVTDAGSVLSLCSLDIRLW